MVLDGIDPVEVAIAVLDHAPEIAQKAFAAGLLQTRAAILGREHDVVINLREGGHAHPFSGQPLRGLIHFQPFSVS